MSQFHRSKFGVSDALVIAVLRSAGYDFKSSSIKDLENDELALALWNDKKTVKRDIYRSWPRDPSGDNILPGNSFLGKMTSNGIQFWGATLWDFFWTNRIPSVPNLITGSTGSKLSKWMIEHKETKHAAPELEWAKSEAEPRQIPPYPIAEGIEAQEMRIRLGLCGRSMLREKEERGSDNEDSDQSMAVDGSNSETGEESPKMVIDDESESETDEERSDKGDQKPVMSFPVQDYPAPWPLVPFSYEAPKIEQRLPLHRLPKRLVVHDPWDLLSIPYRRSDRYRETRKTHDWTAAEDKTYIYHLSLGRAGEKKIEGELEALKKEREHVPERVNQTDALGGQFPDGHDGIILCPNAIIPGPAEPPILAIFPAAPDTKPVEEAHLYISPDKIAGEGNHSLALQAEWEIPRSLVVPDTICNECILEDVRKTLVECDGEDGSRKPAAYREKSGHWKVVERRKPEVAMDFDFGSSDPAVNRSYLHNLGSRRSIFEYAGPVRHVKTNVKWQNADKGPYCSHVLKRMHAENDVICPHPPTARVSLVAKLSTGDSHLKTEARNYGGFPNHFFEHWNGYNVVDPLHKPVPVNAVVPQYYGYYEPEGDSRMSPILLMEACGKQIDVSSLCTDDKYECAALFYKFHHGGYLQESPYPRNILYQEGPLDRPRYQRGTGQYTEDGRKYAFRLIDFGRSRKLEDSRDRAVEESTVAELFKIFHFEEF